MKTETWIPIEECKDGFLYEVNARNFRYGVFVENHKCFLGIRHKFNMTFVDAEYHWDTSSLYGTVKPIKKLKKCSVELKFINDKSTELTIDTNLLTWLQKESGNKYE